VLRANAALNLGIDRHHHVTSMAGVEMVVDKRGCGRPSGSAIPTKGLGGQAKGSGGNRGGLCSLLIKQISLFPGKRVGYRNCHIAGSLISKHSVVGVHYEVADFVAVRPELTEEDLT
jgi:hypothetical protein